MPTTKPTPPETPEPQEQPADVPSDRIVPDSTSKKPPLPINEIEKQETDVEGG